MSNIAGPIAYGGGPSAPILGGRRVQLRALAQRDYDFLYSLETANDINFRWRFRGTTPSPERFTQSLWDGVLASFVIVSRQTRLPLGVVTAYGADMRNRTVFVAVITTPSDRGGGHAFEAMGLFIDYLFAVWDFRKLYVETFEFNLQQFASVVGDSFVEEGRLVEHEYFAERYWDKIILALPRSRWEEVRRARYDDLLPIRREVEPTAARMSSDEFYRFLTTELTLDAARITGSEPLEDLGLDSFGRYQAIVLLERLTSTEVPEALGCELRTPADIYDYYKARVR